MVEVFRCRICDGLWEQHIQNSKYKDEDICAKCSEVIDETLEGFIMMDLIQHLSQTEEEHVSSNSSTPSTEVSSDVREHTDEGDTDNGQVKPEGRQRGPRRSPI